MILKNHWKRWGERLFYIGAMLLLILFFCANVEKIAFDAFDYYTLSQSLKSGDGGFSLLNFPQTIRGVSGAIHFFVIGALADFLHVDIRFIVVILNFFLLLGTVFLYVRIFDNSSEKKAKHCFLSAIGVVVLFAVFARYSVAALLMDLPSMCFIAIGAALLFLVFQNERHIWIFGCLSGICLYSAYNMRSIYLFSIIIAVLIFLISIIVKKRYKLFAALLMCFAGILIAAVPQVIVNYHYYGVFSIKLYTAMNPADESLFVKQLFWGLDICRYDTYVNSDGIFDVGRVAFKWPGAQNLMPLVTERSLKGYIVLMAKNPLYFLALYTSHFLNMLSPYFKQVYIMDLFAVKWPYLIAMFTVCYMTVWDILMKFQEKIYTFKSLTDKKFLLSLVLLFPALAIVPGAVEHRFGLPLFFLIFIYFVCICSFKKMWKKVKENPIGNLALFGIVLMFMLNFWITTLSNGPIAIPI
ncbi:MAG: hypothetical protein RR368_07720 [Oscillospiraceae bacterium]